MSHVPAERCLDIIELLAEGARTMPLGEIAETLNVPKSGAHRLLATLVDLGWAEKDPETSFYRLTMRLAILGQQFFVSTGIPDICQPQLDALAGECREFARLAMVDGDSLTWVAHAQGATTGLMYHPSLVASKVPLYATASGKAWLATLPADQAMKLVLKAGFGDADRYGPNVVRNVDALMREVKATARRGWGLANGEAEPGVTAVAVAILPEGGGAALGTVSIAGPSVRLTDARVREIAPIVSRSAAELARLWPLRPRTAVAARFRSVAEAA
jgi:DNA-binding IclR family transcriptional regulator